MLTINQNNITEPMISSQLMDDLTNRSIKPVTQLNIVLLKRYIQLLEAIGYIEHSSDWDLNLTVTYKLDNKIINRETEMGYADIEIGDLNEDELQLITNHDEVTSIGFYFESDDEDEPVLEFIPLQSIISIHVHRH